MILLDAGTAWAFWICAPLMVVGALGMVLARKAVYSALCLALVMVCLAIQYAAQDAPFLFVVQVIVYTGAVMMLFLFVVMIVGVDSTDSMVETIRGHKTASALAGLGVLILLVSAVWRIAPGAVGLESANADGNVQGIAALVFGRYVFAFEATAALLITAAVGAMVLAHSERLRPKIGQTERAAERIRAYATHGTHPGALPNSGVFARHNSIATPALLPDGSVAPESLSGTLLERAPMADPAELAAPTHSAFGEIESVRNGDDE